MHLHTYLTHIYTYRHAHSCKSRLRPLCSRYESVSTHSHLSHISTQVKTHTRIHSYIFDFSAHKPAYLTSKLRKTFLSRRSFTFGQVLKSSPFVLPSRRFRTCGSYFFSSFSACACVPLSMFGCFCFHKPQLKRDKVGRETEKGE